MFTRNAILRHSALLLFALFFCFLSNASGQLLTLSCSPTTGPTQAGVAYSAMCTASGSLFPPYTWAISSGTLPDGLALTTSSDTTMATISGTPTTAGPYDYTLQATDSTPILPMTAQQEYSGTIAPNITSINPATTTAGGPDLIVTVNGAGFGLDSVVDFNGTAVATTVVNSNQVTATITADLTVLAGSNSITLTSAGATSNTASFTVTPTVSSVLPSSATAGGPGFLLIVNGTGFETGATVNFSAASLTATVASPTQLSVSVPASLITTAGPLPVSVTSGGLPSNSATFTVAPAPTISSIAPTSTTAGGAALTVTVNGSGFGSDAVVNFNGTALTTIVIGATQVTALVPASLIVTAGTVPVTVTATSSGVTSNSASFAVLPGVSSISPASATAGGPDFTLTVNGSGFTPGAVVQWNGSNLATSFVNATQLTAPVLVNLIATPGTAQVTVSSGGLISNAATFTVLSSAAITSITPATVTAGGPAFTLTVNGSGFSSDTTVQWNGSTLSSPNVLSSSEVTVSVPANLIASPGSAQITVKSGGVTSNAETLTVAAGPALFSISPSATTAGGPAFTLTVNGTGFASGAVVEWNAIALTTTFVSSTELTAAVPANLIAHATTVSVSVQSGGLTSNPSSFTVGLTLGSISPSAAPAGGPAFILTANGTGFASGAVVQWNGSALPTTFESATQLTASVASSFLQSYGEAQITVVSGGLTSNALPLSIDVPAITLTGLQSTSAPTQQLQVGIQLANPSPTALTGTLQLSFSTTAPGVPAGYIDPALQFAAGGTTLNFTIPAGSTSVSPLTGGTIQQGTVEGIITVTMMSLTSGGTSVLPSPVTAPTVTIPTLPPVITAGSAQITNLTASGFDVVLSGYSTTRDMTSANFTFTAASGTQFTGPATFTVPLSSLFSTWFSSAEGQSNGSMFLLTVPFTISGDTGVLQSVSVTLTNSVGTSVPATASQ